MLSRNVSVFSSSAALFEKLDKKQLSSQEDSHSDVKRNDVKINDVKINDVKSNDGSILNRLKSTYSRTASSRKSAMAFSESSKGSNPSMINRLKSRVTSVRKPQASVTIEENTTNSSDTQQVCICTYFTFTLYFNNNRTYQSNTILVMTTMSQVLPIRLSTHQITLLLSSIWVQSIYPLNTPENFEAIAHTYSLVLLVARSKVMQQFLLFYHLYMD
jgi:hypothetical protein